jgi:hypothetical protein
VNSTPSKSVLLLFIVSIFLVAETSVQATIAHVFNGTLGSSERFGLTIDCAGDVNVDGFDDVIVGATRGTLAGSATVFSGLDGTILYSFSGAQTGDNFGFSVSDVLRGGD